MLIRQQSYWRAFGRGIITGLGAVVGTALVLALLGGILRQLVNVDFIRPAVEAVLPYVERIPQDAIQETLPAPQYQSPSPSPEVTETPASDNSENIEGAS
jgi:hypothetical protein